MASELLGSMRKVTKFTSFFILPLGILLFLEAYFLRNTPADTAIVSTSAALLGMLPKGLVLLISVSLAAGVIRLAKMKILVQNNILWRRWPMWTLFVWTRLERSQMEI